MFYKICVFSIKTFGARLLLTNASFIAFRVLDPAFFMTIGSLASSATLIDKESLCHRYALRWYL